MKKSWKRWRWVKDYNALSVDHSIEADKDGSTVTLLDIMGQQDDNYDLTERE